MNSTVDCDSEKKDDHCHCFVRSILNQIHCNNNSIQYFFLPIRIDKHQKKEKTMPIDSTGAFSTKIYK
jgi:hypothetical protein